MLHALRYSYEVKQAAVARILNGENRKQVAREVGCNYSAVNRWFGIYANGANPTTKPTSVRRCPRCAELAAILKLVVETANAAPTIRAGVLRIAADAITTPSAANSDAIAS